MPKEFINGENKELVRNPFNLGKEVIRLERFLIDRICVLDKRLNELDWYYQRLDEQIHELRTVVDGILDVIKAGGGKHGLNRKLT